MFPNPLLLPEENATDSTGTSNHEPSSGSHELLKRELEEEGEQSEEGEEEMQEVGGGENEQSIPPLGGGKMDWSEGAGLTSLLRIDENWLLQNGQLDLDLAISRGKVLEPLSDHEENSGAAPPPTEEETSTSAGSAGAGTAAPSALSLDAYLDICGECLKFSRADLNLAKSLYNVIECSGEKGLSLSVLRGTMIDSEYYSYTIDDQIQCLCNLQMV